MEIITSRTNPLCTHLRKLASSVSYRRDCGEFLCDSPKLLEEALLWRAGLRTVVCTDPAALPALPDTVRRVQVPGDLMKSISPAQTPQGVLSVRPAGPDASGTVDRPPVRGPGRGSGSGECGDDPPDGGRLSRRRIVFGERLRGPIQSQDRSGLHGCGVPLPGVDLRAGRAAGAADEERPALVWRGPSERYGGRAAGGLLSLRRGRKGLSADALAACDLTVRIPMSGHCESLNAAAAAAVLLWEAARDD